MREATSSRITHHASRITRHVISPTMSLIELRNVSKRFGRLVVLNGVTLNIEQGQSLVIIGASGVGRACTESFVTSFLAIIVLNFFFAQLLKSWYLTIYGQRSLFG